MFFQTESRLLRGLTASEFKTVLLRRRKIIYFPRHVEHYTALPQDCEKEKAVLWFLDY